MVNVLEKQYFKKYLHKNCHRSWFSKWRANAQYKDRNGTHGIDAYADEYTLRIWGALEDPYLSEDNRVARGTVIAGHSTAALTGITAASIVTGPFAPLFGGLATVFTVGGAALEVGTQVVNDYKNHPEDVYFRIAGDDSYWKIEQVPCDGIREWAYKMCRWSNEVYKERYEQKKSDNYEFQAYIEQRPPTPY